MKCLSSIWKLRKQSDRVKIILWLYLAACIFLFLGAKAGVEWIQVVRKPVTYRLLYEKSGQEENDPIKKIRNLPHVLAASHENKETITLTGNWGEMAVTCVELDADYMKLVYHISDKETMKTIYFNEKAYQKYKKTAKISKMQEQAEGGLQSQYYITDQEREKPDGGTARLILLKETNAESKPYVYMVRERERFPKESEYIRVQSDGREIGQDLEEVGYMIQNKMEIQKREYQTTILKNHFNYRLMIAILLLLSAQCMRRKNRKNKFFKSTL